MNGIEVLFESLERNNFFYGKLLDVKNLKLEQSYFIRKRWLLNRTISGSGVVCGLDVTVDAAVPGRLVISPGLALDFFGREIIVGEDIAVDATTLTDDKGLPVGSVAAGTTVEIRLAYAEIKGNPVPVLVADCDNPGNCAPDLVLEQFRILVQATAGAAPAPPACPVPGVTFTADGLNAALEPLIAKKTTDLPAEASIPIARFTPSTNTLEILSRPLVYSNPLLYGLICCLAERVSQVAGALLLLYQSGDGQSAKTGTNLPQPIVVRAVDAANNPATGLAVQFNVTGGGGSLSPVTEKPGGLYEASWKMGPAGPQTVTATVAGSALSVTFTATSKP
jgi:hypothetical protein